MNAPRWTEELQAGDKVITSYYRNLTVRTIDRTTPTQLIIGSMRFRRSDGAMVGGDSWNQTYLVQPTPEMLAKAQQNELARDVSERVQRIRWDSFTLDQLKRIAAVLDEQRQPATQNGAT